MNNTTYTANILRGIIVILLIAVIIILLTKNNHKTQNQENISPSINSIIDQPVIDQSITNQTTTSQSREVTQKPATQNPVSKNYVTPPAEGEFVADAITNFNAVYNKINRKFMVHANVAKGFMFEANVPYKVYDSKGNLITTGSATAYGEDSQSQNDPSLPVDIEFVVPNNIKENEILVFRILADNASGLPAHDKYWGTVIKVQ